MVRKAAADQRVLNLFGYTGSFSVYSAAGGASSTTTVDLSKNYLQWAKRNFEVNGLTSPSNVFVADDSVDFLETAAEDKRKRFDLAVVDPPTYSNSKRTEIDWDVQSRHVELLENVHSVMRLKGVVFFSTAGWPDGEGRSPVAAAIIVNPSVPPEVALLGNGAKKTRGPQGPRAGDCARLRQL